MFVGPLCDCGKVKFIFSSKIQNCTQLVATVKRSGITDVVNHTYTRLLYLTALNVTITFKLCKYFLPQKTLSKPLQYRLYDK